MVGILYDGLDELYRHAKFGEIEQRAPAVGAKMWCLYVCFFVTLRGRRAVRSTGVDYTLSRFCVAVCGSTLKQLRTVTTTVCDCCCVISK